MYWFKEEGYGVVLYPLLTDICFAGQLYGSNLSLPRNVPKCKTNIILVRHRRLPSCTSVPEALANNQSRVLRYFSFLFIRTSTTPRSYMYKWIPAARTTMTNKSAIFRWGSSPTVLAFFPGSTPNRWHGIAISPMSFYLSPHRHTSTYLQISAPQI